MVQGAGDRQARAALRRDQRILARELRASGNAAGEVVDSSTFLSDLIAGTLTALKALVVDANKRINELCIGTLRLGAGAGTAVTSSAAELNILTGVTATAAEINRLDGPVAGSAAVGTVAEKIGVFTTTITLAAATFTLTDDPGVGQVAGIHLYTFPQGLIAVLGAVVNVDVALQPPFILATTGYLALGTGGINDAAAMTGNEEDIIAETAFAALTGRQGPTNAKSAAVAILDGTAGAKQVYLNYRIDDDAAHATTAGNTVTGTVTLVWANAGSF